MKKMIKNCTGALTILLLLSSTAHSEKDTKLFPEIKGWNVDVGEQVYTPENLWDLINGAADAYLSYDFRELRTAVYSNNKGQTVKVYAFKHSNPTNAFGIYSQERNPDYDYLNIGAQGFKSPGALYFIKGPYYIQISTNDKVLYEKLDPLAREIDAAMDLKSTLPEEISLLPEDGKIKHSEKYIANDFLGYSYMHSAFVAEYKKDETQFQVFIIAPETEEETNEMLNSFLDTQEVPNENRNKNMYKIEAKYIGSILLYKSGKYLCGIKKGNEAIENQYLKIMKGKL